MIASLKSRVGYRGQGVADSADTRIEPEWLQRSLCGERTLGATLNDSLCWTLDACIEIYLCGDITIWMQSTINARSPPSMHACRALTGPGACWSKWKSIDYLSVCSPRTAITMVHVTLLGRHDVLERLQQQVVVRHLVIRFIVQILAQGIQRGVQAPQKLPLLPVRV